MNSVFDLSTERSDWYFRKQEAKRRKWRNLVLIILVIVVFAIMAHIDYLALVAGV